MTKHAPRVGVAPSLVPQDDQDGPCGPGGVAEMFLQHMDPEHHQDPENPAASASVMRPDAQLDGAEQQHAEAQALDPWFGLVIRGVLSGRERAGA